MDYRKKFMSKIENDFDHKVDVKLHFRGNLLDMMCLNIMFHTDPKNPIFDKEDIKLIMNILGLTFGEVCDLATYCHFNWIKLCDKYGCFTFKFELNDDSWYYNGLKKYSECNYSFN